MATVLHSLKKCYISMYNIFHRIEKIIVFMSFAGEQYSDNPRAISEKMHELYPEYKIVWLFKKGYNLGDFIPDYVTQIEYNSIQCLQLYSTACCFVSNNAQMKEFPKRNGQIILRTWHGDRGMKKIANQKETRQRKFINTENVDLFTAGSEYGEKRIREAFSYKGEIINGGCPRNDCLVTIDAARISIVKKRIGLTSDSKVLLYAPTFRDGSKSKQECDVDLEKVLSLLMRNGEKWVCITRAHHISKGLDNVSQFIDVTDYPDMADILLISDMLITDYSSSCGDFILKNKPVILTHFDIDDYTKNYRGFCFDPKAAGYLCVYNNDELFDLIQTLDDTVAAEECRKLKNFYGICESGHSAEVVCNRIVELVEKIFS